MSAKQDVYAFSWCLKIGLPGGGTIYAATTDLPEPAAVSALGAVYRERIVNLDAVLNQALPDLFYGIDLAQNIQFTLNNADGVFNGVDLRLVPATLTLYDRITATATVDFVGMVVGAQTQGTQCIITLGSVDPSLFNLMLPAAVINAEIGSPFAKSSTPGAAVPVVFGGDVLVQPPSANNDTVSDPGGSDLLVGFGALQVTRVFAEAPGTPNKLTVESDWTPAPGNPAFYDTTHFLVTDDQSQRVGAPPLGTPTTIVGALGRDATADDTSISFGGVGANTRIHAGDTFTLPGDTHKYRFSDEYTATGAGAIAHAQFTPPLFVPQTTGAVLTIITSVITAASFVRIRFRTTASGSAFVYSMVKGYDATVTPHHVQIQDAVLDSGLNSVEINGDFFLVPYNNVTDGLLPVPAGAVDLTAIRTWSTAASPTALVRGPGYQDHSRYPSDDLLAIITDLKWGLSAGTGMIQQVDATSFAAASTALAAIGTGWGAANMMAFSVNGALGHDQHQRQASGPINEILMMFGGRLWQDHLLKWHCEVDTNPGPPSMSFLLGPGDSSAFKIKRVLQHGFKSLDQAIRNVVLHWDIGGSASGVALNVTKRFTPRDYGRTSTAAVSGIGQDKLVFSQWIIDPGIAELVAFYIAEKLKGADETCQIEVGVEARDVTLGQAVSISVPSDGISGSWQVSAIAKTLTAVTLTCFRLNTNAYGQPSGVITSSDREQTPGTTVGLFGTNEIPNPNFAPPISPGEIPPTPHDWTIAPPSISSFLGDGGSYNLGGDLFHIPPIVDRSAAIKAQTIGGHYIRVAVSSVSTPQPTSPLTPGAHLLGLFTSLFSPVQVNTADMLRIVSTYCDQTDGLYAIVSEFDAANVETGRFVPLTYLATDTNALGWGRFYGYWRPSSSTTQAFIGFGFSRAGTFQLEAAECQRVGRMATKPPPWQRHREPPPTLFASAEVTFNGAATYSLLSLIPAGAYVIGAKTIVTQTIVLGTAVGYLVGTVTAPDAWVGTLNTNPPVAATNVSVDRANDTTGSFTNIVFFPLPATVQVSGMKLGDAGEPTGTITSGKLRVQVEYTLSAPVSSN